MAPPVRRVGRAVGALALAGALGSAGCAIPGLADLLGKGVSEVRGGRGEVREVTPLPRGPALDRYRSVRVLPVERSEDAGPVPTSLAKVVEEELRRAIRDAKLFPGGGGPALLIRTRLTTHWPAEGFSQAISAYSEILARVEFLEDGQPSPLAVYYVRGVSTAIKRKSDQDLGRGLASGVVDVLEDHRTPVAPRKPLPAPARTPGRAPVPDRRPEAPVQGPATPDR